MRRATIVLVCTTCHTHWNQQDIDEFNGGQTATAITRHRSLHQRDGKTHSFRGSVKTCGAFGWRPYVGTETS